MKLKGFNKEEALQRIDSAPQEERGQVVLQVMQEMLNEVQESMVSEYVAMAEQVNADSANASKFGLRALSAEEKKFYQELTSGSFKTGNQSDVIPTTLINYVFEDLRTARPLLSYINWTPAGVVKWIISEKNGVAKWGELLSTITDEIKGEFKVLDFETHKLSAYSLVPLAIIDLGFDWVDKYFREILLEALEAGLEEGIVNGDGKNSPVGLNRALTGVTDGVHPLRTAVPIEDFSPTTIGEHLSTLTDGGKRAVPSVVFVSNPADYFTKVMPASTILTSGGEYRTLFPHSVNFIQSVAVPAGRAIMFVPNCYTAGVSKMQLRGSDDFKFLDHLRTYKIVAYGNGRIKKENMAIYFDIENLKPLAFNVNVVNGSEDIGA